MLLPDENKCCGTVFIKKKKEFFKRFKKIILFKLYMDFELCFLFQKYLNLEHCKSNSGILQRNITSIHFSPQVRQSLGGHVYLTSSDGHRYR